MRLADLRKLAIRKQYRIRFHLPNGMECVVSEHGIAQVPGLAGVPDFNLEDGLAAARQFILEPVAPPAEKRKPALPQRVSLEQLAAMATAGGPEAAHAEEHDE